MAYCITLTIGGISIAIQSEDSGIIELYRESFKGFISSNSAPIIKISIAHDEYFDGVNPYIYGNPHRTSVVHKSAKTFLKGSTYRGSFDLHTRKGEIRQGLSDTALYLFLRSILSLYLPQKKGFLMHATSILRDGKVFLFSGPPQSGKSTVARLSENYTVLSDDFSIVRKVGKTFCCFGSPFWGHVEPRGENIPGTTMCVPIKALYFLYRDGETYIRKLNKVKSMSQFLQNILTINNTSIVNEQIISLAEQFIREISIYNLHFRLDNLFWRCIKND